MKLLQELLVSRQDILQKALFAGSLENMWKGGKMKLKIGEEGGNENKNRMDVDLEYDRYISASGCLFELTILTSQFSNNVLPFSLKWIVLLMTFWMLALHMFP